MRCKTAPTIENLNFTTRFFADPSATLRATSSAQNDREYAQNDTTICHSEELATKNLEKENTMYYVYMLTNKNNNVLYTGVTNNLKRRVYEHKNDLVPGFTNKYRVHKLVYFDMTTDVRAAIEREKQIKGWTRVKKDRLINDFNPEWKDLWEEIL